MITVNSISIKEFRGIRDLTLELGGKNFAVCGPNGTGKSGIVDALEFALTGNISRLSGTGTGALSVKEHGPHVDSRNRPKDAAVTIEVHIPSLKKTATIWRSVHDAKKPIITPDSEDIRKILSNAALHPEFVLSRRELIRYVLTEPANRSKEVQALLRLNEVESLRALLQKISNASKSQAKFCDENRKNAASHLLRALNIPALTSTAVLESANPKRAILGLPALSALNPDTSLKDGLTSATTGQTASRVVKTTAKEEIDSLQSCLNHFETADFKILITNAKTELSALQDNEDYLRHTTREAFLQAALSELTNNLAPCVTQPGTLRRLETY